LFFIVLSLVNKIIKNCYTKKIGCTRLEIICVVLYNVWKINLFTMSTSSLYKATSLILNQHRYKTVLKSIEFNFPTIINSSVEFMHVYIINPFALYYKFMCLIITMDENVLISE
jgi:hypothetical protein